MRNWRLYLFTLLVTALLLTYTAGTQVSAATNSPQSDSLTLGILPIVSTERLVKRFSPLANYLSTELNITIRLETAPDYKEFLRRTNEEKRYDVLITAPHFYYLANRLADYRALVKVDMPSMQMLIVARGDSGIVTTNDLKGRKLATVDPLALGTILIREHLVNNDIVPGRDISLVSTPSHNASLLSAYKGVTDAASLMVSPYKRAKTEIRQKMKIIDKTRGTPTIPISVASRIDEEFAAKIKNTLLNLNTSQDGKTLLNQLGWPGFIATQPGEYNELKSVADQIFQNE